MTSSSDNYPLFSGFLEDIPDKVAPCRIVKEYIIKPEHIAVRIDPSRLGDIGTVISRDAVMPDDIGNPYVRPDGFLAQIKSLYNDSMRKSRRLYMNQVSPTEWRLSYV
jgi:hypothetical protein